MNEKENEGKKKNTKGGPYLWIQIQLSMDHVHTILHFFGDERSSKLSKRISWASQCLIRH